MGSGASVQIERRGTPPCLHRKRKDARAALPGEDPITPSVKREFSSKISFFVVALPYDASANACSIGRGAHKMELPVAENVVIDTSCRFSCETQENAPAGETGRAAVKRIQGFVAHKKQPPLPGTTIGP